MASEQTTPADAVAEAVASVALAEAKEPEAAVGEASDAVHPYSMHGRVAVKDIVAAGLALDGQTVTAGGWVQTGRYGDKNAFAFIELNDGSGPTSLQLIVRQEAVADSPLCAGRGLAALVPKSTCLLVRGSVRPSKGRGQVIELDVAELLHVGPCDPATYPVAKTKLSLEFLRSVIHLRTRTNTIATVARVRNCLANATHRFFQGKGFIYVHSPLITSSDCEGAGEMFQVSTLLGGKQATEEDVAAAQAKASEMGSAVKELKTAKAPKGEITAAVEALKKQKAEVEKTKARTAWVGGLPRLENGEIDYKEDFFGRKAFLTVSGQMEAEVYACALTSVYTFGPTFRAEDSHTRRHLAEFWMIEPEIAFCDLEGNMRCAEDYVRFCCNAVLEECAVRIDGGRGGGTRGLDHGHGARCTARAPVG